MIDWSARNHLPLILNTQGLLGIGVEVGVQQGIFSQHIRKNWGGSMLVCVDQWLAYPGSLTTQAQHDAFMVQATKRLDSTGKPWTLMREPSIKAAQIFDWHNTKLDFVYLDADHAYESVMADIAAWWPRIVPGGILAGHDFIEDGWHRHDEPHTAYPTKELGGPTSFEFGVTRAVTEFCKAKGLEFSVTDPDDCQGWRSWLVVKP